MITFKKFQNTIIASYRLVMMAILLIMVMGVLAYLSMVIFYAVDRNWAVPVILSPTQDKVLSFQAQEAALEAAMLKNKVDLFRATETYKTLSNEINNVEFLMKRFNTAAQHESAALSKTVLGMRDVLQEKRTNTLDMEKAAHDAKPLLESIDQELAAGLITKDNALSRRMTIQSALNSATDSRINQITFQEQERLASNASDTLGEHKGATSLTALQSLNNEAQLNLIHAQAIVDAKTAQQSIEQLQATVDKSEHVLQMAQQSPYYLALTKPTSVAFVQYDNLDHAQPGAAVYDCLLQFILCRKVGIVTQIYDAEEYIRHPLFKTDIKGKFIGIDFTRKASSESSVVFLGYKPLLL